MNTSRILFFCLLTLSLSLSILPAQAHKPYVLYPQVKDTRPKIDSPFIESDKTEYVVAVTKENKYAVMAVTLSNERDICPQLVINYQDFPALASTGLHSGAELGKLTTITGRSLDEITRLARPGGLSQYGFLAEDEHILDVLTGDNRLVENLELTHPLLAKPLFHVLNMMDNDLVLNRWNMARHHWDNIQYFYYKNHQIYVDVVDTKDGQQSIFNDSMEGGFYIKLWFEPDPADLEFLQTHYSHLTSEQMDQMINLLMVMTRVKLSLSISCVMDFMKATSSGAQIRSALPIFSDLKPCLKLKTPFPANFTMS